jgi:hypothetical protein
MANEETTPRQREGRDLIETWLEQQPLESKLAACLLWSLTDGDTGNPSLANQIFERYEKDLLAAAQDSTAPIGLETRTVLGCWISQGMVTG